MSRTNKLMGDAHEAALVEALGGKQSAGSGNKWWKPMDGRHNHRDEEFAFAWDGKSTFGKSLTVTDVMWNKAEEQAGHERPMLGLRWYDPAFGGSLLRVKRDLVVIRLADMSEMLAAVRERPCR